MVADLPSCFFAAGGRWLLECGESDRWTRRAGDISDYDNFGSADGIYVCERALEVCRVPGTRAQPGHTRAYGFLRSADRRESRVPVVQRAAGGSVYGRRRGAWNWRSDWRGRGHDQTGVPAGDDRRRVRDRKSTRLNSSHLVISY